jgi:heterodisulfide reductase subunit A
MRTYGFAEDYYRQASDSDVKFIRFEPDDKPEVTPVQAEGRPVLRVAVSDPILGQRLAIDADYLSLAAAVIPAAGSKEVAQHFKVSLGPDGFFKEAHVKLRPVEFGTDGIYLCGLAHYPKHIPETINQAYGAASLEL